MLNAAASRNAKQSGQQMALDMYGSWKTDVLEELRAWLAERSAEGVTEITIEQFRAVAKAQPASFRAWGPLPMLACKEGLLAPLSHADGSPVMRAAESVRTHGHFVRCWAVLSFSAASEGNTAPSFNDRAPAVPVHTQTADNGVGEGRHSHSIADAMHGYHAGRGPMDQAMGDEGR